jgi:hypothetical protein
MKIEVTEELRDVFLSIIAESKSLDEWAAIESDDMFQSGELRGGFDATETRVLF